MELESARKALLDAKAKWERSPSAVNAKALDVARADMDLLLDLNPPAPKGPGPSGPPPLEDELLSYDEEGAQ